MKELTKINLSDRIEELKETIPELTRLENETKRLMMLVKKGKHQDGSILDIHSLITLAKEQVERLKQTEEIETLSESIPKMVRLQDETKRLMALITKGRPASSNMLDFHSLITLAKEKVEQLTNDEKELKTNKIPK